MSAKAIVTVRRLSATGSAYGHGGRAWILDLCAGPAPRLAPGRGSTAVRLTGDRRREDAEHADSLARAGGVRRHPDLQDAGTPADDHEPGHAVRVGRRLLVHPPAGDHDAHALDRLAGLADSDAHDRVPTDSQRARRDRQGVADA